MTLEESSQRRQLRDCSDGLVSTVRVSRAVYILNTSTKGPRSAPSLVVDMCSYVIGSHRVIDSDPSPLSRRYYHDLHIVSLVVGQLEPFAQR